MTSKLVTINSDYISKHKALFAHSGMIQNLIVIKYLENDKAVNC